MATELDAAIARILGGLDPAGKALPAPRGRAGDRDADRRRRAASLLRAGNFQGALNVAVGGSQSEAKKINNDRVYTELIEQFLNLGRRLPGYVPAPGPTGHSGGSGSR